MSYSLVDKLRSDHVANDPDADDWESWCKSRDCISREWPCDVALLIREFDEQAQRLEWFEVRRGHPNHIVRLSEFGWAMDHPIDCRPNVRDCRWNAWLDRHGDHLWTEEGAALLEIVEYDNGQFEIRRYHE